MCYNSPWLGWMSAYSFRGFLMWCCRIVIIIQIIRWLIEEKENRTVNLWNDLEFAGMKFSCPHLDSIKFTVMLKADSQGTWGINTVQALNKCTLWIWIWWVFVLVYLPNELNKIRSKLLIGCRLWCSIIGWSIQLLNISCSMLSCCLSIPIRPT